jgi:hypothetical protein
MQYVHVELAADILYDPGRHAIHSKDVASGIKVPVPHISQKDIPVNAANVP